MEFVLIFAGLLLVSLAGFYTILYTSKFLKLLEQWLIKKNVLVSATDKPLNIADIFMFILCASLTIYGAVLIGVNVLNLF